MIKQIILSTLSLCFLCAVTPAQAAIQRSADFEDGHAIGIGLYGLSYDYGIGFFSAGLSAGSPASYSLGNPLANPLRPSLRLFARFYEQAGLSAGLFTGLNFDPGTPGERAYLIPDLGLGVAYDFRQFNLPFALRLNLSLALNDSRNRYYSPDSSYPTPNFFQRLTFGPQTSLELAWMPSDQFEVTLGGGTLLGMRMKF
ncbi:MAG: hypothetical protein CVV27_14250 [Candidatus Melainabacteria bacterium HGW-Melainabacteria-1]|nr:MAG: hypothetical protein CVV27_14250 [Candidatus Melainabacteria bacterium HGW-Melainabacteria-1]